MKNLLDAAISLRIETAKRIKSVPLALTTQPLFYLILLINTFLFTSCKKNAINESKNAEEIISSKAPGTSSDFLTSYNVNGQTLGELMQLRAATKKYQDTLAARADGYINLNLKLPNMGFHFGKPDLIKDGIFDLKKPEFLVYNPDDNGVFRLIAVEYGVPMVDPNDPLEPQPAGFTGDTDLWDPNTLNTGLWTLHTWVWKFNPDGVFNMTNPNVIVR